MGSRIRELSIGTYNKNVARTYNWKISIVKFPPKIKELIKKNYPLLFNHIGGDEVRDNEFLPLDAFCTSLSIPSVPLEAISVMVGGTGIEIAGGEGIKNFVGEYIIDADFAFYNVFRLWSKYANQINGYHNYTGNLIFEKLSNDVVDGQKKVVARYDIPSCWAKEVSVNTNDSSSAVANFSVTFTSLSFDLKDIPL